MYAQMDLEEYTQPPPSSRGTASSTSSMSSIKDMTPSPAVRLRPAFKNSFSQKPEIVIYPKKISSAQSLRTDLPSDQQLLLEPASAPARCTNLYLPSTTRYNIYVINFFKSTCPIPSNII